MGARSWSGPTALAAPRRFSPTSVACAKHGTATQFSVGWAITAREPAAIGLLRERDWTPAVDPDGERCPVIEAAVAELTGLLPAPSSA
jgi:hypothetical protein